MFLKRSYRFSVALALLSVMGSALAWVSFPEHARGADPFEYSCEDPKNDPGLLELPAACDFRPALAALNRMAMATAPEDPPAAAPQVLEVRLVRQCCTKKCTFGTIYIGDKAICRTLELPWRNNEVDVSCIPTGTYACSKFKSKKLGDVWAVEDVDGRTFIRIHAGSSDSSTLGCIILAVDVDVERNRVVDGITGSKKAMDIFRKAIQDCKKFNLTITDETKPASGTQTSQQTQ